MSSTALNVLPALVNMVPGTVVPETNGVWLDKNNNDCMHLKGSINSALALSPNDMTGSLFDAVTNASDCVIVTASGGEVTTSAGVVGGGDLYADGFAVVNAVMEFDYGLNPTGLANGQYAHIPNKPIALFYRKKGTRMHTYMGMVVFDRQGPTDARGYVHYIFRCAESVANIEAWRQH